MTPMFVTVGSLKREPQTVHSGTVAQDQLVGRLVEGRVPLESVERQLMRSLCDDSSRPKSDAGEPPPHICDIVVAVLLASVS